MPALATVGRQLATRPSVRIYLWIACGKGCYRHLLANARRQAGPHGPWSTPGASVRSTWFTRSTEGVRQQWRRRPTSATMSETPCLSGNRNAVEVAVHAGSGESVKGRIVSRRDKKLVNNNHARHLCEIGGRLDSPNRNSRERFAGRQWDAKCTPTVPITAHRGGCNDVEEFAIAIPSCRATRATRPEQTGMGVPP